MAMTVDEVKQYIWNQTDTVATELPTTTLDSYLQEAFNRTVAVTNRWPYYESSWALVKPADSSVIPLPGNVSIPAIMSLSYDETDRRLNQISQEEAESYYIGWYAETSNFAHVYSIWQNQIWLWPQLTTADPQDYTLRGYRRPLQMTTSEDPQAFDIDERLIQPLAHYAVALAYAQQEAFNLEDQYMKRWEIDVGANSEAILDPSKHRPVVLFGNRQHGLGPFRGASSNYWAGGINVYPPSG